MRFFLYGLFNDPRELAHLGWRERANLLESAHMRSRLSSWGRAHKWWHFGIVALMIATLFCWFIPGIGKFKLLLVLQMASSVAIVWLQIVDARHRHAMLQSLMLERGICPAVCFRCRYDLKNSTSDTCPECGEVIATEADKP